MEISSPFSNSDGFQKSDFLSNEEILASPIRKYFKGKTVFLTGATGYLGQLLMEKLLRCDVKQIYILARTKKDKSPGERFRKMFEEVQFSKLKKYNPNFMQNLIIIEGDLSKPAVGINSSDIQLLESNVEIILHAAADVRFNESLLDLILTNLRGTKELLKIAENCKKLQVFNYISTAYSNCARGYHITEEFHEPPIDIEAIIAYAERCRCQPDDLMSLEYLTKPLIGSWPNTYTFTKSLSEELVRCYGDKFPICVVRPSIVISVYNDPEPGWTNSMFGLNGMLTAIGLGLLRICHARPKAVIDVVCADLVINATLATTWATYEDSQKSLQLKFDSKMIPDTSVVLSPPQTTMQPKVYAIVSSSQKLTFQYFHETMMPIFEQYPPKTVVWPIGLIKSTCPFVLYYLAIFSPFLAMLLMDFGLALTGNKIRVLPIVRKIHVFQNALSYFCSNNWKFDNMNMLEVCDRMHPVDKRLFLCDTRLFKYEKWLYTYLQGLKQYLFKDSMDNQKAGRVRYERLRIAQFFALIGYYLIQGFIIYFLAKVLGVFNFSKITIDID